MQQEIYYSQWKEIIHDQIDEFSICNETQSQ